MLNYKIFIMPRVFSITSNSPSKILVELKAVIYLTHTDHIGKFPSC